MALAGVITLEHALHRAFNLIESSHSPPARKHA
jgi:hypothetical protein